MSFMFLLYLRMFVFDRNGAKIYRAIFPQMLSFTSLCYSTKRIVKEKSIFCEISTGFDKDLKRLSIQDRIEYL